MSSRTQIINALVEQTGVKKSWCKQFQTKDLKDMLDKFLFGDK